MLIDRILDYRQGKDSEKDLETLRSAIVFNIDNVAAYLDQHPHYHSIDSSIPNAAPPYDNMWFEYHPNRFLPGLWKRVGIQICSCDDLSLLPSFLTDKYPWLNDPVFDLGWFLMASLFWELPGGRIECPDAFGFIPVRKDGKVELGPTDKVIGITTSPPGSRDHALSLALASFWITPLIAISFLHCKNVSIKEEIANDHLQMSRKRRGKFPLLTYHTLEIRPIVTTLHTEGGAQKEGLARALHICRGHFKDFSRGSGLFGKYKGLYWWDSQARGSAIQGLHLKDYKVSPS